MKYAEWWKEYGTVRGKWTEWFVNTAQSPPRLIFTAKSYSKLASVFQDMADHWPGEVVYLRVPDNRHDGENIYYALVFHDEYNTADRNSEAPASPLDTEHWEGTPEHVRLTLGRQMELLSEMSETLMDPDKLAELSARMNEAAAVIGLLFRPVKGGKDDG